MSEERKKSRMIVQHLLNKCKDCLREIETHETRIKSAEATIRDSKLAMLKYSAERQALLERAIDYGYDPETGEIQG